MRKKGRRRKEKEQEEEEEEEERKEGEERKKRGNNIRLTCSHIHQKPGKLKQLRPSKDRWSLTGQS